METRLNLQQQRLLVVRDGFQKHKLMMTVSQAFEKKIAEMRKVVATSREMTRDAIGRLESRYDTSRVEMGWLTTGLGAALGELEYNYSLFKANSARPKMSVSNGACFEAVAIPGTTRLTCFVCQGGAGLECEVDGKQLVVISPDSPIAVAALGKTAGDIFTVNDRIDYQLLSVA